MIDLETRLRRAARLLDEVMASDGDSSDETAVTVAPGSGPRQRWPMVAAAAIVVAAGVGTIALLNSDGSTGPATAPPTAGTTSEEQILTGPAAVSHAPKVCTAADQQVSSEPDWRQYADYRTWTRDGCLVRIDVLADRPGPDHCDYGSVRVIITGDPMGERYTNDGDDIEYVRDPRNRMGLADALDLDSTLPDTAMETGYRSEGEAIWLDPLDPLSLYLVTDDRVEKWPRVDSVLCE